MDELCHEFGELVYHSKDIIKEFYELLSVKNNLFDCVKDQQKELKQLEIQINNLTNEIKSKVEVNFFYLDYRKFIEREIKVL